MLVLGAVFSMLFMVGPSELGNMAVLSCLLLGAWLEKRKVKIGIIWSLLSSMPWVSECKGNGLHSTCLSPTPLVWTVAKVGGT